MKAIVTAVAFSFFALTNQAVADPFGFTLSGSGIDATINLYYSPNPNVGILPGTSPNPVDPIGSFIVTGISGSFSDAALGITNAAITGIVLSNPANPHPDNLLAPHSFGFYPIANGVMTPGGPAPGLSYDNLFYPDGSPQAASDYPFSGGVFDIYGIVFTLADGNAVNLWSNGFTPGGLSYGVAVTDGIDLLDYSGPVALAAVPEPASWALMIGGFGIIGAASRRRRHIAVRFV